MALQRGFRDVTFLSGGFGKCADSRYDAVLGKGGLPPISLLTSTDPQYVSLSLRSDLQDDILYSTRDGIRLLLMHEVSRISDRS